jgi:DNA polymerase-3 subunit epsilon
MLDWLKNINKEYPEFWKAYLSKFESKPKTKRFVTLSSENTGLNIQKDVILSLDSIGVINDCIVINDSFDVVLLQYKYLHDNGLSNEFIIQSKQTKLPEPQAIQAFIEYIGNAILVGYRIDNDVEMINEALEKMNCGRLKNEAIDVEIMYQKWKDNNDKPFSLETLYADFKIPVGDVVTSTEEAYNIALLFLKLKSRLGIR